MRRAGEAQHLRHIAHVVARVLGQFGGGENAHEVDHALEGGGLPHGEAARQVLTRHAELLGQLVGADRSASAAHDALPDGDLQRGLEMQHGRRLRQRPLEPAGEGAPEHELAGHTIVHAFDEDVGHPGIGRSRHERRVGGQQRRDQHERETGELLGPRDQPLRVVAGARVDDDDVDEFLDEVLLDVRRALGGVHVGPAPRERRTNEGPRALTLEQRDHAHRWRGAVGTVAGGHQRECSVCTPARGVGAWAGSAAGSSPRTMAWARISTSRALA